MKLYMLGLIFMYGLNPMLALGLKNSDTSTISIRVIKIPEISVDNVEFEDFIIGSSLPDPKNSMISITGGGSQRLIRLSLEDENIELSSESEDKIDVRMSITNPDLTLDDNGDATGEMRATILVEPTIGGSYSGTAKVNIEYN